jgi:hypothetical protein
MTVAMTPRKTAVMVLSANSGGQLIVDIFHFCDRSGRSLTRTLYRFRRTLATPLRKPCSGTRRLVATRRQSSYSGAKRGAVEPGHLAATRPSSVSTACSARGNIARGRVTADAQRSFALRSPQRLGVGRAAEHRERDARAVLLHLDRRGETSSAS